MELVGKIVFDLFMTYDEYNAEAKNKNKEEKNYERSIKQKSII